MPEAEVQEKKQKGCTYLLIRIVVIIASVFMVEYLLHTAFGLLLGEDEFTEAMKPFQDGYFSFNPYFITLQTTTTEFFTVPFAAVRFMFFFFVGFILYGIVTFILGYISPLKKWEEHISNVLFYGLIALCLYISCFLPKRKAVFDREKKEMTVTTHNWFIEEGRATVPFRTISEIGYDFTTDDDWYHDINKRYLRIYALIGGKKFTLGDKEIERYKGRNAAGEDNWKPSKEMDGLGANTVKILNKLIEK